MSIEDRQPLLQAKELILKKQYAEARTILYTLPGNPTAQKWLAKLDEIAPQTSRPRPTELPAPPPPMIPSVPVYQGPEPMNPNEIAMWRLWFAPVMIWNYTRNWKRLGKPEWVVNTALAGLLFFAWVIIGIVLITVRDVNFISLTFLIAGAMANLTYWIIIGQLQSGAYKTWIATHDRTLLQMHPYKVDKGIIGLIVIAVVITLGMSAYFWNETRPKTFTSSDITLTYTREWEQTKEHYDLCDDYGGCFLILDKKGTPMSIAFTKMAMQGRTGTAEDIEYALWENYWKPVEGTQLAGHQQLTIDGLSAASCEFYYPSSDGKDPLYMKVIVVVNGQTRYDITIWTNNKADFDNNHDKIMDIIHSIDFKSTGPST